MESESLCHEVKKPRAEDQEVDMVREIFEMVDPGPVMVMQL